MSKILKNSMVTPDGTEIISRYTHDFVSYTDANGKIYAVDGGLDYIRRFGDIEDCEDTSIYTTSPISKIREVFTWGTYGKEGNQPLVKKLLKDLDDDHIEAIIKTQHQLPKEILEVFSREQDYRSFNDNLYDLAIDTLKENFKINMGIITKRLPNYIPTNDEEVSITYLFTDWDYAYLDTNTQIGETH